MDLSIEIDKKWALGVKVKKKSGSEWEGIICGYYQHKNNSWGIAVASSYHAGSVQIYPTSAMVII